MKRSLLLGCGNSREKRLYIKPDSEWGELTTLDIDPNCGADVIYDLDRLAAPFGPHELVLWRRLPFDAEAFDEIHAYDVLEHVGQLGNWRGFFTEMAEYHRILKPAGRFSIIVPIGQDALADPGHTRFFHENHFLFLSQQWYEDQLCEKKNVTDYRWYWTKNFNVLHMSRVEDHHLGVILEKA